MFLRGNDGSYEYTIQNLIDTFFWNHMGCLKYEHYWYWKGKEQVLKSILESIGIVFKI